MVICCLKVELFEEAAGGKFAGGINSLVARHALVRNSMGR